MSQTKRYLERSTSVASRHRSSIERRRVEGDLRTPEIILGERLSSIRNRQGLTAEQFAARVAEIGGPRLDRATVSRIEGGQRSVSLNEAFILAAALGVAPVNLFVPTMDTEYVPVHLTPDIEVPARSFRDWARGDRPLAQLESQWYWTEVPNSELVQRSVRVAKCTRELLEAERRERVAQAKADLISERLAALGDSVLVVSDPVKLAERRLLDSRLDVALDRVAVARVQCEDAHARLAQAENDARRAAIVGTLRTAADELEQGKSSTRSINAAAAMLKVVIARVDAGDDDGGLANALRETPDKLAALRGFVEFVEATKPADPNQ